MWVDQELKTFNYEVIPSHEVCRASNSALAYMASVTAREEADVKEEKDTIRQVIFNNKEFKQ